MRQLYPLGHFLFRLCATIVPLINKTFFKQSDNAQMLEKCATSLKKLTNFNEKIITYPPNINISKTIPNNRIITISLLLANSLLTSLLFSVKVSIRHFKKQVLFLKCCLKKQLSLLFFKNLKIKVQKMRLLWEKWNKRKE